MTRPASASSMSSQPAISDLVKNSTICELCWIAVLSTERLTKPLVIPKGGVDDIGSCRLADFRQSKDESDCKRPSLRSTKVIVRIQHPATRPVNQNVEFRADFSTLDGRILIRIIAYHLQEKVVHAGTYLCHLFPRYAVIRSRQCSLDVLHYFKSRRYSRTAFLSSEQVIAFTNKLDFMLTQSS